MRPGSPDDHVVYVCRCTVLVHTCTSNPLFPIKIHFLNAGFDPIPYTNHPDHGNGIDADMR
jgi:hypothetical protein